MACHEPTFRETHMHHNPYARHQCKSSKFNTHFQCMTKASKLPRSTFRVEFRIDLVAWWTDFPGFRWCARTTQSKKSKDTLFDSQCLYLQSHTLTFFISFPHGTLGGPKVPECQDCNTFFIFGGCPRVHFLHNIILSRNPRDILTRNSLDSLGEIFSLYIL